MPIDLPHLNEKEDRILNAAISVFSEKGYNTATTKEIAAEAGVAEGTIFRYYKTKKDLLHGIILRLIKTMGSKIALGTIESVVDNAKGKPPKQVVREIIADRIALVRKMMPMLRVLVSEVLFHEDIREAVYETIVLGANEMVSPLILQMQREGYLRDDIAPAYLLRMMISNILVFIASRELFPQAYKEIDFEEDFEMMFELMLNGFAAREG